MAPDSPPPPATPKAANPALQARSRETLDRILAAAEELLETREFDELTMVDLADHAGCGVGTVYGRLENKESLLLCLHEQFGHGLGIRDEERGVCARVGRRRHLATHTHLLLLLRILVFSLGFALKRESVREKWVKAGSGYTSCERVTTVRVCSYQLVHRLRRCGEVIDRVVDEVLHDLVV